MPAISNERRLAAIMVADVVGYSRLMAEDEDGTLSRLKEFRSRLFNPSVAQHGGRIVKLMGDGALVEFASVTAAVECAEMIRSLTSNNNVKVRPDQRIELRIGISLGDVIVDGADIYGDGVNIAARLEGVADTGEILVSGPAYDQAMGKASVGFEFIGEKELKNIPDPVRVYRATNTVTPGTKAAVAGTTLPARRGLLMAFGGTLAAVGVGASAWWLTSVNRKVDLTAEGRVPATDTTKPSVVVLPFDNLSRTGDQSYFSDGMTENIITDLSKISGLLVIARNTSFTYKDQSVDVQSVARELGVRYLVEGSVQRSEDRVRISAKLVDAPSGYNLWAEKFDRNYADLFSLQDEVTSEIADALKVELTLEERRAIAKHHTENLEAYDLFLRAWERYWQFNDESRRQARQLLKDALALDPKFARAQALLAATYTNQVGSSLQQSDQSLDRAFELAQQAVEIDGDLPQVHWVLGLVYMFRRNFKSAEKSIRLAIKLDPNFADAYALLCWNLQYAGEPERGLEAMEIAMRLNPRAPFPYLNAQSEAYFSLGEYDSAIAVASQALQLNPAGQRLRMVMAASLAHLDRTEDAQWEIQELLIHEPDFNLGAVPNIAPYGEQATLDRLLVGLRRAGLPE